MRQSADTANPDYLQVSADRLAIDSDTLVRLQGVVADGYSVVRFQHPDGKDSVFVNEPSAVRQVLVKSHRAFGKGRDFERVKMLLGNGIIVSDGQVWRSHRRMMQPAFTRKSLEKHLLSMTAEVQRIEVLFADAAASGAPVDVTTLCSEFALRVILRAIFGRDADDLLAEDGSNPFRFLSEEFARDLRAVTKLRSARDRVAQMLPNRRQSPSEHEDFLQALVDAVDKEGNGLSEKEIIDEVMTLVVAGYETSAGTLNWAWALLAEHSDWATKIAVEAATLPSHQGTFTAVDAEQLKATRAVLDETLRLFPPVWLFSRKVLEAVTIAETYLTPGTQVYVSPYLMHRRADLWPEPEDFRPGRQIGEDAEKAFLPFSLGPRRCIGEHFAYLEMQLHLARLCRSFRLTALQPPTRALELGINLRSASRFLMQVEQRQ